MKGSATNIQIFNWGCDFDKTLRYEVKTKYSRLLLHPFKTYLNLESKLGNSQNFIIIYYFLQHLFSFGNGVYSE